MATTELWIGMAHMTCLNRGSVAIPSVYEIDKILIEKEFEPIRNFCWIVRAATVMSLVTHLFLSVARVSDKQIRFVSFFLLPRFVRLLFWQIESVM
jgi:hypothetical protein